MSAAPFQDDGRTMSRAPGPTDVWARLARLDGRCIVKLESVRDGAPGLRWRVTIRLREEPDALPISRVREKVLEALEDGIGAAEARRWHLRLTV